MRWLTLSLAILLATTSSLHAQDPFGDISDLKLANPNDKTDMATVPPPKDAILLCNGKNLDNWLSVNGKDPAKWTVLDNGFLQVKSPTSDIMTTQKFTGNFLLHVEFRCGYQPMAKGQRRGNSGVYLQGRYEVQILDTYGSEGGKKDDCAAIYSVAAPTRNVCKAPTVWQTYDVDFQAPTCVDGAKTAPAVMTIHHNGVKVHDKVKVTIDNSLRGIGGDVCSPGPILLQENGCPVQFRNIWLKQAMKE